MEMNYTAKQDPNNPDIFIVTDLETGEVMHVDKNSPGFQSLPSAVQLAVLYASEGAGEPSEPKLNHRERQQQIFDNMLGHRKGGVPDWAANVFNRPKGVPDWVSNVFNRPKGVPDWAGGMFDRNHSPSGWGNWSTSPGPSPIHWIGQKYPHLPQGEAMKWFQRGYDPFADGWDPEQGPVQGVPQFEQAEEPPMDLSVEKVSPQIYDTTSNAIKDALLSEQQSGGPQFAYQGVMEKENLSEDVLMRLGKAIADIMQQQTDPRIKSTGAATAGRGVNPVRAASRIASNLTKTPTSKPKSGGTNQYVHGPSNRKEIKQGPSGFVRGGM